MRLTLRASGPVPVDLAWERYADPVLWPTWAPHLRSVTIDGDAADDNAADAADAAGLPAAGLPAAGLPAAHLPAADLPAARLRPGLTGVVHGVLGVRAGFTVLAVDGSGGPQDRRSWSWRVRSGPITLELLHTVELLHTREPLHAEPAGTDAGGSRTTLVLDGAAPVVLAYAPVAWYALHRLVTLPA